MIEKMNVCTGETKAGPCGGKDISLTTTIQGEDVRVETRCNTCGKADSFVMPVLNYISPKFIELYNKKNQVVVV